MSPLGICRFRSITILRQGVIWAEAQHIKSGKQREVRDGIRNIHQLELRRAELIEEISPSAYLALDHIGED